MSREQSVDSQNAEVHMIDTSSTKHALDELDIEQIKLEKTISQQDHDKLEKDIE